MDLKRWAEEGEMLVRRKSNSTSNLPLFEKYQFFTPGEIFVSGGNVPIRRGSLILAPGVFMSLLVLIILLSILAVGLKALSSLEVSYGAFDKEMGPAAQKKQL